MLEELPAVRLRGLHPNASETTGVRNLIKRAVNRVRSVVQREGNEGLLCDGILVITDCDATASLNITLAQPGSEWKDMAPDLTKPSTVPVINSSVPRFIYEIVSCEHGSENLGFINGKEFLEELSYC